MDTTNRDTVILTPTRHGKLDTVWVSALLGLAHPLSARVAHVFTAGMPVAEAYNALVDAALKMDPPCAYLLTLEDDNLPERGTLLRLLDTIGDFDAISALYYLKDEDERTPVVFGYDLLPLDVRGKDGVVPCGGVAFGCCLWRADVFRRLDPPWFRTIETDTERRTHDLYFASKLAAADFRVGVNLDAKVGHIDYRTGKVY